ncbi:MAG: ABC transporter ATP-binding protein [Ignavibacteriae bacterium]|nr:ABC transporter ATP-binding protein [Ignavibacteriota bacterium]
MKKILQILNLKTYFFTADEKSNKEIVLKAVDDVSLDVYEDEILGIVGESGSGKTVTAQSIMQLIPEPSGKIVSGEIFYKGEDILKRHGEELRKIRGKEIAYIFQETYSSLNPVLTIEEQICEVITTHLDKSYEEAAEISAGLLESMGIKDAADRIKDYPHQFSGGMRQRIALAMALAAKPALLIADEPTTMLDVTIQKQILDLFLSIKKNKTLTSVIFITHNLGLVSKYCDRVAVMYAGKIQEISAVEELIKSPLHPYTKGLLYASAFVKDKDNKVYTIPGNTPSLKELPQGCKFCNRCTETTDNCFIDEPPLIEIKPNHFVRCHLYREDDIK